MAIQPASWASCANLMGLAERVEEELGPPMAFLLNSLHLQRCAFVCCHPIWHLGSVEQF